MIDLSDNSTTVHASSAEPWRVTVVDTGYDTMTGGRIKRVQKYIGDEPFFLTYGDAVADIDIPALLRFHKEHRHVGTLTAVNIAQICFQISFHSHLVGCAGVARSVGDGPLSARPWHHRFHWAFKRGLRGNGCGC